MEISISWNICRVCLIEEEKKPRMAGVTVEPMRHIFNGGEMLAKQIYACSGVAMKPNDNLPEKICKKCYTLIKCAVKFRDTCRASDVYLQNILQRTNSASALFKKEQPPSVDALEDFISNDCSSIDNNVGNGDEASDKPQQNATLLEKSDGRFKGSEYADMIEFGNEEYFVNENSEGESGDSQTIVQTNSLHEQKDQLNQESIEDVLESETEDFKQEGDESVPANCEKEVEDNTETYEQLKEFITHKETNHCEIVFDMDSESEDSQAKVSSTVAVREDECEVVELEVEDTNDMHTEYIAEFLIDDQSRDSISLQNSPVLFVNSKNGRYLVNKHQTHVIHSKSELNKKTASKVEEEIQAWVCDICGNHFASRQILNAHLKIHRQEKNHECEICLKRFITACNLQAHMRIHTGEKPFECKYCGRRFSDRTSSLRHERTHTNERPFQCQQCGKAFSLSTTLKKHLKVHTGERSFRCDICDKSFKLPHQLKAHTNSTLHKAAEQSKQMDQ